MAELETRSEWYRRVADEIYSLSSSLSKRDYKKYRLATLLGIARRVDRLSSTCEECHSYKEVILNLVQGIGNMIQLGDRETAKRYFTTIEEMTKHLRKVHKLVSRGYYVSLWSGIGLAIGMAVGVVISNSGIGTAIGTVAGLLIGLYLDYRAKKEDRIL